MEKQPHDCMNNRGWNIVWNEHIIIDDVNKEGTKEDKGGHLTESMWDSQ